MLMPRCDMPLRMMPRQVIVDATARSRRDVKIYRDIMPIQWKYASLILLINIDVTRDDERSRARREHNHNRTVI